MLLWVFGEVRESAVSHLSDDSASGIFRFDNATVRWFLSVDAERLPDPVKTAGQRTYRSIRIDGDEIEFSEGFTDLHTASYADILNGGGFGIEDARPSISLVHAIRTGAEGRGR
jgi:UDP-N-acetyl-2-amino-2-deoxyglucuronate dehydrogenase